MKYDINGNLKLSKLFANSKQTTLNLLFLQTISITSIEDTDIAINGRILDSSLINYSNNSSTDQVVFRINNNGEAVWTTVLDYQLGYDAPDVMTSYGSTIYSGMYASLLYPWFISLNGTDGSYMHSNCFTFFLNSPNDYKSNKSLYKCEKITLFKLSA